MTRRIISHPTTMGWMGADFSSEICDRLGTDLITKYDIPCLYYFVFSNSIFEGVHSLNM